MRLHQLVLPCLLIGAAAAPFDASHPGADEGAVIHALNRLAFGPRPGEVETVHSIGLDKWIERQLHPQHIADTTMEARLKRLETLTLDPPTIAREYIEPARRARRDPARRNPGANAAPPMTTDMRLEPMLRPRQVLEELVEAKLLRAIYSERQLAEVLTDFWFNHFNVFARKGPVMAFATEYERDVIRPRVFGKFRDLLGATAKSPAMLFYLDNAMNGRGGSLNENYARELMELHTLGVDGGYTQDDVVAVARAFTGWTAARPTAGGFRFAPRLHDAGEKRVLGHTFPAGSGVEDGERVLDLLAQHPSTARHIAYKLAQRLVSDTPPPALVDRAAARFRATDGDLREVTREIITSREFFAAEARRAKIKTPLEFVVSAVRATNAEVASALPLARAIAEMGMPLYLCPPPTGYDDTAAAWTSPGSLVSRINFALDLAANRLPGIRVTSSANPLDIGNAGFQRQ